MSVLLRSLSAVVLGGLALAAPASALAPGELYAVSGAPGANAFLPGVGNDSWLGSSAHSTTYLATSNTHKLSDDGRYVTFVSSADGLFSGDDDRYEHVYRQDRDTGALALVDVPAAGGSGDGDARDPAISADGTRIAFTSTARLVPQDTDDDFDVYVRDLAAGTTTLMSTGPSGPGVGAATDPDISRDGTKVAFAASQPFLAPDADTLTDVYTASVATGTLALVSRANGAVGALPNRDADNPTISGNGNAVAWVTEATNLDAADTDSSSDVYVRTGNTTILASVATGFGGAKGNNDSGDPAMSPDGTGVAFTSYASNLDPAATGSKWAVFLRKTATGETSLISRATGAAGAQADDMSWGPTISTTPSGLLVAFASSAKNLSGATTPDNHAFVRAINANTTTLVSRLDGASGGRVTVFGAPSLPAGGTAVAFGSDQDDVTTGDDNRFSSVFVREGTATTWRSRPQTGDLHGGSADAELQQDRAVSADGTRVLFASSADGQFPGDAPSSRSAIWVRDLRTGALIAASRGDGADGPIAYAYSAQISADGTKVMFATDNPIGFGTPAGVNQVYLRDLTTNRTTLVSAAGATPADSDANPEAMSADGRYVLFSSTSPVFGVVAPSDQLFRKDLSTGEVALVTRDPGTGNPLSGASDGAISADGSRVAFTTADKLSPKDTDAKTSVYVRDMAGTGMTLVSHAPDGTGNDDPAYGVQISDDGTRVAFVTGAKNLDPADTDGGERDGYVADLSAGTVTLATGSPSATAYVSAFTLSGDGRRVAWTTDEALVPDDTDTLTDVYARDLPAGPVTLAGRGGDGAPLAGRPDGLALSPNGGCLAVGVSGATAYGYPPVPSPHIPGTEPSPDFRYVVLRALDDSCVRPVPAAATPKGGGGGATGTPADRIAPVLSKVSLTNTTFRRSAATTAVSARLHPRGTTLRFTLSETSTVTVRFDQRTTGRKVGRSCRKATRKLRKRRACTRYVARGTLTRKGLKAGANRIAFTGRLGRKALPLGRYRVTLVARDAAGNPSKPKVLGFRIVRR